MLRRLEKGLTSAKSAAAQPQQHQSPSQQTNGEPSSRPYASPGGPGATRERSHSTNTNVNFASPTNPVGGWPGHGSPTTMPTPGSNGAAGGAGVGGPQGPVQYIQIPEYPQQTAAMQQSPAMSMHTPLGSTGIGGGSVAGSMTQSPMSRKRRSRSPTMMMDDDRYGSHHHTHPHHRSNTLTSNVRGTEDGEDSENEELGPDSSSDDDNKRDVDTGANNDYSMFPANLLAEEKRASFFKTILNPTHPDGSPHLGGSASGSAGTGSEKSAGGGGGSAGGSGSMRKRDLTNSPEVTGGAVGGVNGARGLDGQPKHIFGVKKPPPSFDDPITVGLVTEEEAKTLFELCVTFLVFFLIISHYFRLAIAHIVCGQLENN